MSYMIEQTDEQVKGTKANINYELSFDRAPQHLVDVKMRVDAIESDTTTFVMPVWSPGSYKVRDYVGYQGNVRAYVVSRSGRKQVDFTWRDNYRNAGKVEGSASPAQTGSTIILWCPL